MVKIPGLDDLKKMGSGLIDSAKALKLGDMVDKVKTGVGSVTGKRAVDTPAGDEGIKKMFEEMNTSLNEVMESQSTQNKAIRNIQGQLSNLAKAIEASQKTSTETVVETVQTTTITSEPPTTAGSETTTEETKKP